MSKKPDLFTEFHQAQLRAKPQSSKDSIWKKTLEEWDVMKKQFPKKSDFDGHIKLLIKDLDVKFTKHLANNSILKYLGNVSNTQVFYFEG